MLRGTGPASVVKVGVRATDRSRDASEQSKHAGGRMVVNSFSNAVEHSSRRSREVLAAVEVLCNGCQVSHKARW